MANRIDAHLRQWSQREMPSLDVMVKSMIDVDPDPYQTRGGVEFVVMPLVRLIERGDPSICPPIEEKVRFQDGKFSVYCDPLSPSQEAYIKRVLLNPPDVCKTPKGEVKFKIKSVTYYSRTLLPAIAAPLSAAQAFPSSWVRRGVSIAGAVVAAPVERRLLEAPLVGGGAAGGVSFEMQKRREADRKAIVMRWIKRCFEQSGVDPSGKALFVYKGEPGFGVSKGVLPLQDFLDKVLGKKGWAGDFSGFCQEFARQNNLSMQLNVPLTHEELMNRLLFPLVRASHSLQPATQ